MCEHKNIVVDHYANEETNMHIGCRVRCDSCDEYLFNSKDKGVDFAYKYIEDNRDKFDTLKDYTCDDLNNRFDIEDGFDYDTDVVANTHNLLITKKCLEEILRDKIELNNEGNCIDYGLALNIEDLEEVVKIVEEKLKHSNND